MKTCQISNVVLRLGTRSILQMGPKTNGSHQKSLKMKSIMFILSNLIDAFWKQTVCLRVKFIFNFSNLKNT